MLTIVPYESKFKAAFKQLNIEWIEQYFVVEPHDLEQLDYPEEILAQNGMVFIALWEETPVGTVSMLADGTNFELAKMAVSPAAQGKQIGKALGEVALAFARERGARRVWLESNRVLVPALTLYAKLGFVEYPIGPTLYSRANIAMEVWL